MYSTLLSKTFNCLSVVRIWHIRHINGHIFPNRKYYKNRGQPCGIFNERAQNRVLFKGKQPNVPGCTCAHIYIWIANERCKSSIAHGFLGVSKKCCINCYFFSSDLRKPKNFHVNFKHTVIGNCSTECASWVWITSLWDNLTKGGLGSYRKRSNIWAKISCWVW